MYIYIKHLLPSNIDNYMNMFYKILFSLLFVIVVDTIHSSFLNTNTT